jgi:hypothetical protein
MAKRIVTNKFGLQGIYDDETKSVTPLSESQKIVTNKSGLKGIYDSESEMITPMDDSDFDTPTPAPASAPSFEQPKKKDVTESVSTPSSWDGKLITGFGSLNTGETGAEKAIGKFSKAMATHPIDTSIGVAKGAFDFAVDSFSGLLKFAQAGGSAGVGAPSQFIAAQEKGIIDTGEKTYKQRLEASEQIQKEGLDKLRFGSPEGKNATIVTYDKKTNTMGMRAPDADAFGYEAGKGIAQIASMAFGGTIGLGASFFSSLENNYNQARKENIPADRAFVESAVRSGAETASDKFIGISSMIERAMARNVSKSAINQLLSGEISREAFGAMVESAGKIFSKEGLKTAGKGFVAEGAEEFSQEYMDEGIKKLFNYYQAAKKSDDPNAKVEMYDTKGMGSKELFVGALNSGVYGGIIGSMGGAFINSKEYSPTIYSTLQNAYDDSGVEGLDRAKANIVKGVDRAITDKLLDPAQRELVLNNLDLMGKSVGSFQQKSEVDGLTRFQKFQLENYDIPNHIANISEYVSSTSSDQITPNQGDIDKDIEDGAITEIPYSGIVNVPEAFKPYIEKAKFFQEEGDLSVVAKVPNSVKEAFDQNEQTKIDFGQAVNQAIGNALRGSNTASYDTVVRAGSQLFEDKDKQSAFKMELSQHKDAIEKRLRWSNYLNGLQKGIDDTGKPFDISARNKALDNINNYEIGTEVNLPTGGTDTIADISADGQTITTNNSKESLPANSVSLFKEEAVKENLMSAVQSGVQPSDNEALHQLIHMSLYENGMLLSPAEVSQIKIDKEGYVDVIGLKRTLQESGMDTDNNEAASKILAVSDNIKSRLKEYGSTTTKGEPQPTESAITPEDKGVIDNAVSQIVNPQPTEPKTGKPKVVAGRVYDRALSVEDESPEAAVIKFFASGGKVMRAMPANFTGAKMKTLTSLFSKPKQGGTVVSKTEVSSRNSISGRKTDGALSIDEIAHKLWEDSGASDTNESDYLAAVEDVLMRFPTKTKMSDYLLSKNNIGTKAGIKLDEDFDTMQMEYEAQQMGMTVEEFQQFLDENPDHNQARIDALDETENILSNIEDYPELLASLNLTEDELADIDNLFVEQQKLAPIKLEVTPEEKKQDNINKIAEDLKKSFKKETIEITDAILQVQSSLSESGITVKMFNTTAEFNEATGLRGTKAQGVFMAEDGAISLNREAMEAGWGTTVVFHEGIHPIMNIINNTNGKLYDSVVSGILKLAKTDPQFKAVSDFVKANYTNEESIPDEILVESIARIASGKIQWSSVPSTLKQNLIDFINKVANALGYKKQLLSNTNEGEFKKLANDIVRVLKEGSPISEIVGADNTQAYNLDSPSGYVNEAGEDLTNGQMQFSLINNYRDPASGVSFSYIKDSDEFEQLKKDGYITEDKTLADFDGAHIFLHQPDAAFTGMIMKNGQLLVKGNGGIFYPINFHKEGYFWASTAGAANAMAAQLNENARLNKGRVLMALTSAPSDKLLSSTTSSAAVLDIFKSKTFDDAFGLSEDGVTNAIFNALEKELVLKTLIKDEDGEPILKDGEKQYKTKKVFLKSNGEKLSNTIPRGERLQDVVSVIKLALAPDKSSFKERKFFTEQLISNIADMVKGTPSEQKLGEFFHMGINNESFKWVGGKKGYGISASNLRQAISYMLTEPLLRQKLAKGETEGKGGNVYAILEMEVKGGGDAVKAVESGAHESYPMTVAKTSKDSKIKLHILQDRQMWSDHFQDFETGKIPENDRLKKVFPTSGVSAKSLKLDIQKNQLSQGSREHTYEGTLKDAGLTEKDIKIWKDKNKRKKESAKVQSVMDAAERLWEGEITYEEYLDTVKSDQPIIPFTKVPSLPTIKDIIGALQSDRFNKGILTLNDNIQDGQYVSSRLDIPAYRAYGIYIATVHDAGAGAKVLAYGQTAVLKNVSFNANPRASLLIARGVLDKSPFAKISGNWVNEDPEAAHARAELAMNDPSYVQVGFNPARHSFFYDKATGSPMVSADEVIQIGALVLAKNPVTTTVYDAMFTTKNAKGEPIQFSKGARDSRAAEYINSNKDIYTEDELAQGISMAFGYSYGEASSIVSETLRDPSTPSLAMVYDGKIDPKAPINQDLKLKNDIIQGSRDAVEKHLEEQEKQDKVTVAGLMEALVDDKWDIRKALEKYSGKKGFSTSLLRTISGINGSIDLKLKRAFDAIYTGLNAQGELNLDRLIFSRRVIQLFENQKRKRLNNTKKLIDEYFKKNGKVPDNKNMELIFKESAEKYPDMSSGVTKWNGKMDVVVTVEMAREAIIDLKAELDKKDNEVGLQGSFQDLMNRSDAYKAFSNESLKEAHRAGMISDEVYADYKDDFYSYRVTVDRLFESMNREDQFNNRRTMEKAFGSLSKTGTENAIMTNSRISMGLSYGMMHKAIKRNELKKSIFDDTVAKGLGNDLFKPANFLISKKTGEKLTDEKGDRVGTADSGFTHIGIKVDGRNTYYQMKTSLFNQMEGLNKTYDNPSIAEKKLIGLGNVANRTLTAFATRYNPLFFDSNIPMDLGQQIIFTDIWDKGKTFTNIIGSSFRAIARTSQFVDPLGRNKEKVQEVLEDWIEFGGSMDLISLSKEMKEEFTSEGAVTLYNDPKKKTRFRKFKEGISYFNAKTEVAMRLAAFNEVRNNMLDEYAKTNKSKPSENEMYKINTIAAAQSRAYTDFAQKGTYLPSWNMAYLNSSVQAFASVIEYAANNPAALTFKFAQMGAGGFAYQLGMMSALALFGAGGMDDVTEYEKDRNILVPLFFTKGKDKYGNPKNIWHFKKIRVNPSIVPFWIATRKSAELAFNALHGIEKKPMTTGQMIDGTVDALNEALPLPIPIATTGEGMSRRVGQVISRKLLLSAVYKGMYGIDAYRGKDVRSYDDIQGVLSAEGLDNKNVPYIYKFVGKTVGLSPVRTQAVAETFITSPTTNILTGVAYGLSSDIANAIIPAQTKTERGEYMVSNLPKAFSILTKKSFTQSNPDYQINTETQEKYKKQVEFMREANTKDRLMEIDLKEIKDASKTSEEFFQRAITEYVPKINKENNLEKTMSAYKMIEQMTTKDVKMNILSKDTYLDAIILKNSGDAVGRAKMLEYMFRDDAKSAEATINYSATLGLSAEDVYFTLEEYKKLIKK